MILDVGTKHGLKVGMELVVIKPQYTVESVRITKLENTRCEAIMTQIGEESEGPQVGWRLSTESPWKASNK